MSNFFELSPLVSPEWLDGSGPESEIVISSRLRLARNIAGRPFPHRLTESERMEMTSELGNKIVLLPGITPDLYFRLQELSAIQRVCLKEMLLIGGLALKNPTARALLVSENLKNTVMINGEDHLQMSVFASGFATEEPLSRVMSMEQELDGQFRYAFDPELGYLTTSPTNVGTGLKVSVLVHLPALVMVQEIDKVINGLRQLQFGVEGYDGEGSNVRGDIFQVFNLSTLGNSEQDIVKDFTYHIQKLIGYEKMAREQLLARNKLAVADNSCRALAVLKSCRLITAQESVERLSALRMGVCLGLVDPIEMGCLNRALVGSRTAHLEISAGSRLAGLEKTEARATWIREILTNNN